MSDATMGAWLGKLEEWRAEIYQATRTDTAYMIRRDGRGWWVQTHVGEFGDRKTYVGKGGTLREAITQMFKRHKMGWEYTAKDKRLADQDAERDER